MQAPGDALLAALLPERRGGAPERVRARPRRILRDQREREGPARAGEAAQELPVRVPVQVAAVQPRRRGALVPRAEDAQHLDALHVLHGAPRRLRARDPRRAALHRDAHPARVLPAHPRRVDAGRDDGVRPDGRPAILQVVRACLDSDVHNSSRWRTSSTGSAATARKGDEGAPRQVPRAHLLQRGPPAHGPAPRRQHEPAQAGVCRHDDQEARVGRPQARAVRRPRQLREQAHRHVGHAHVAPLPPALPQLPEDDLGADAPALRERQARDDEHRQHDQPQEDQRGLPLRLRHRQLGHPEGQRPERRRADPLPHDVRLGAREPARINTPISREGKAPSRGSCTTRAGASCAGEARGRLVRAGEEPRPRPRPRRGPQHAAHRVHHAVGAHVARCCAAPPRSAARRPP